MEELAGGVGRLELGCDGGRDLGVTVGASVSERDLQGG